MLLRLAPLVVCCYCLNCFVLLCQAVNPACECVLFRGRDNSNRGVFTSPNHPQVYPLNINCVLYTFIAQPHQLVELTFLEFDLQLPFISKCADFVRLFLDLDRPEVNEQNKWNYELCGNETLSLLQVQRRFYSSTPSLILEFHTDHIQQNNTGFRGIYKFVDRGQFELIGGNRRWGTRCTYDFYSQKDSKTGRFFSPGYPQNYRPNSRCQFVFYGLRNEKVRVQFQTIQLEFTDGSCDNSPDYIVIREGLDATSSVIDRLCNTRTGVDVESTGENLFIELVSDEKKERQGFAATFAFVSAIDEVPSRGTSPGSVRLNTEHASFVIDDANTHNPGDSPIINPVTLPDDYSQKKPLSDTEFIFSSAKSKNGTFTSPNFPNPYPGDVTVRYVFQGRGQERVQIIFNEIDLENSSETDTFSADRTETTCEEADSITVNVPLSGGPRVIGLFCGNKRPPMLMSNDVNLYVTFASRGSSPGRKGFSAVYNFVTNYGIKSGEQDASLACSFTFRSKVASNGTFTSPNFPGLYPCNTECHYLFHGDESERLYISFGYFDVEGILPGCLETTRSDYVEFSNFNIQLIDRKMNRLCGGPRDQFYAKKSVTSDSSFFRVTFKSNEAFESTGFEAFYEFRKHEESMSATIPLWSTAASVATTCDDLRLIIVAVLVTSLTLRTPVTWRL